MAGQNQGDNESVEAFVNRRQRQAAALAFARANAHQAYGQNIRNGQALDLPQPSDLAFYGLQPPPSPDRSLCTTSTLIATPDPQMADGPLLPVNTALRSAANTATMGGADKFAARMDALLAGGLRYWGQRYDANLQQEHERDLYGATHAPLAYTIGSLGGGGFAVLGFGPEEAATAAAPRLAGAAQLTAKELTRIVGGGGLLGLGSQTVSDLATGHRSTPGDMAGSVAGGMAGAAALPFLGPSKAGAIDGAVTSATQDFFDGRPVSVSQAAEAAGGGGLLAGFAGRIGREWSDGLSRTEKGQLGETLGSMRSLLNGEPRWQGSKVRAPLASGQTAPLSGKGTYWVPDGLAGPPPSEPGMPWPDMFEDKFGYQADTSANQKIAQANWKNQFRLSHFTPSDMGMITAFPSLSFAPQVVRQDPGQ